VTQPTTLAKYVVVNYTTTVLPTQLNFRTVTYWGLLGNHPRVADTSQVGLKISVVVEVGTYKSFLPLIFTDKRSIIYIE
jgi:hypothetical protein